MPKALFSLLTPRRERMHQAVARELGTAILQGSRPPGTTLEGEIGESERLGVSRTVYREALKILTAKGLIESRPKTGTKITEPARWHMLDPELLEWMFIGRPNERFVHDLFELRRIVEPAAAALAATRADQATLAEMGEALEAMRIHGLASEAGQSADRDFHRLLIAAAGNTALRSLSDSVGAAVMWTTRFKFASSPRPRDPYEKHRRLFDAIRERNPELARAAMNELLDVAHADMGLDPERRDMRNGLG